MDRFRDRFITKSASFLRRRDWINHRRVRPMELVWEISAQDTAEFITENMDDAVLFDRREDLWVKALESMSAEGAVMECGVFQGQSINFMADWMTKTGDGRSLHGFDSFEGLEEDWSGENLKAGFFDQGGKMPEVRKNVELHKGWVQDTVLPFMERDSVDKVSLLHIDTDTYSPAKFLLHELKDKLRGGGIVIFDELVGYPNWRAHEFRALTEELDRSDYRFIAFTSRQAAIRVT